MNERKVLHGIDLVRLLSFFCIVTYHCYSAYIFVPYDSSAWAGTPMFLIHALPRSFPFSGFTIVAIYALLAGLKGQPLSLRRPLLVVVPGLVFLFLIYSDFSRREYFWEWDIYHYLLLALLMLGVLSRLRDRSVLACGGLGALLMLLPLWEWIPASSFPRGLAHVLVGVCDSEGKGGWFLLPWLSLPWIYLALGRALVKHPRLTNRELMIWVLPLAAGIFTWGSYFAVDIGPGFYCFMFRQPPYIFWGHFLWVSFALRASADPRIQGWLAGSRFVKILSGLELNRHFGLAYLVHLLILSAAAEILLPRFGPRPVFYSMFLVLLPLTELTTRALITAIGRLNPRALRGAG